MQGGEAQATTAEQALSPEVTELLKAPEWLRWLNTFAFAAAVASATGLVFCSGLGISKEASAFVCAASTFLYATIWGWVLRRRSWTTRTRGWMCVPLAALNAGTALACLIVPRAANFNELIGFALGGMLGGMFVGALVWIPCLLATLFVFGLPLHKAELAARRGLSSEDRGERTLGWMAAAVALIAFVGCNLYLAETWPCLALRALSLAGVALGSVAALKAHKRAAARDQFLVDVRAGAHPELGFSTSGNTELLVRVSAVGAGYREMRMQEPVLEVQAGGDVKATGHQR